MWYVKWMSSRYDQRADKAQREKGNVLKRYSTKNHLGNEKQNRKPEW